MDFKQIEAFVNVVKYRNFSKAADATFLTQPTISAHVNNLEKELGSILLNRHGREITLTSQGEQFYPYALNLMNIREKAVQSVQETGQDMEGVLELQASSIPGEYLVPGLLGGYRKWQTKVKVFLEQSDSGMVMENILQHKGEIGFTGMKPDNRFQAEKIYTDQMILIVPANSRLGKISGEEVSLKDLVGEPLILRENGSGTKKEIEEITIDGEKLIKKVQVVAHMNSLEAIRQGVASGIGCSLVPSCAVSKDNPAIRCLRLKDFNQKREFYMVRDKNTCLSPIGENFWEFVLMSGIKES